MTFDQTFSTDAPIPQIAETITERMSQLVPDYGSDANPYYEEYVRACGAIDMIEWMLAGGHINTEAARAGLHKVWMDRGLGT